MIAEYQENKPETATAEAILKRIINKISKISKTRFNKKTNELKVLLGLSGGVDSALAAILLREAGYQVTCAFMRNWDSFTNNDISGNPSIKDDICSQEKDYQDAKKVATKLALELKRVDFIKEYWDEVFLDFIKDYKAGFTPNPDILCNRK